MNICEKAARYHMDPVIVQLGRYHQVTRSFARSLARSFVRWFSIRMILSFGSLLLFS